jgi:hypothetical protein
MSGKEISIVSKDMHKLFRSVFSNKPYEIPVLSPPLVLLLKERGREKERGVH